MTCSVEGCGRPRYRRHDFCLAHHCRVRRYGDPRAEIPVQERQAGTECSIVGCGRAAVTRGWCSLHYARWRKTGDPVAVIQRTPKRNRVEDLWTRVQVGEPDECWPFTGSVNTYGYGQMSIGGHQHQLAHRLAYQLATGEDPGDLYVCHRCDNPPCCNPAHLFLGTNHENILDAVSKRRHAHGERSGTARLTEAAVVEIRQLWASGSSFAQIARRFGVTPENISYVCHRETWRHVA